MFTLAISFDHLQFALIHGPNVPGSYAILLFTALDFTSTTSHIHSWVLFLLWLRLFILSGVISPLISSSILSILPTERGEGLDFTSGNHKKQDHLINWRGCILYKGTQPRSERTVKSSPCSFYKAIGLDLGLYTYRESGKGVLFSLDKGAIC